MTTDLDSYYEELHGQSDRACALIAAASIADGLRELLAAHFVILTESEEDHLFFSPNATLGDLSSMTEISYVLGLISKKERSLIDSIRRIRNAFAHTAHHITFRVSEVKFECSKLPTVQNIDNNDIKAKYTSVSLNLFAAIMRRTNYLLDKKIKARLAIPPAYILIDKEIRGTSQ
jgi:hypothetical protein